MRRNECVTGETAAPADKTRTYLKIAWSLTLTLSRKRERKLAFPLSPSGERVRVRGKATRGSGIHDLCRYV